MSRLITLLLRFGALAVLCQAQAVFSQGFNLNFNAEPTGSRGGFVSVLCNMPGTAQINCDTNFGFSLPDNKAFVQEIVIIGGEAYYHLILGQPVDGFAQEVFIKTLSSLSFPGGPSSDSAGKSCFVSNNFDCQGFANNARTPLNSDSSTSGNGSGNPNRVVMRQIMRDSAGEFSQEFLKANLTTKPIISQDHKTAEVTAKFVLNMSAIDYNTIDQAGVLTNTVQVLDPTIPAGSGNYSYATHAQSYPGPGANINSTVTGGKYIFTPTRVGLPGGVYTYDEGSNYPVAEVNWESFRDPAQN